MNRPRFAKTIVFALLIAGLAATGYLTRESWLPWFQRSEPGESDEARGDPSLPVIKVIVNEPTQKKLGLSARPIKVDFAWKTILVPGIVVDRPALSDRSVVAPASGIVSVIHRVPGETVRPGDVLFTLKLSNESLLAQTELLKTIQAIKQARAIRSRLEDSGGAVPTIKLIEIDNQIAGSELAEKAHRRELLNRGLSSAEIEQVVKGAEVKEIQVAAPALQSKLQPRSVGTSLMPSQTFELRTLKVKLGDSVPTGQTLCHLANYQSLAIEGQAFRDEMALVERSFKEGWPVEADFQEDPAAGWEAFQQTLSIGRLVNDIDPIHRTFSFLIPVENEAKIVERPDGTRPLLWRFRPGQKVRLAVRVEKLTNVFVLPADAVVRDGPEWFVFTQNVNTFERQSVRLLLIDRQRAVLDNDGSLPPGSFVVQSSAALLNRMAKADGSSGVPKGYHIHADGSLHKNEDEGK